MNYAIISDIHGNERALAAALGMIDAIGVDRIVCLGDVVGGSTRLDGANACCDMLRVRNIPTVCGNHDAISSGVEEPWGFHPAALAATERTREALREDNGEWLRDLPEEVKFEDLLFVHGAPGNHNSYLFTWEDVQVHVGDVESQGCRVCFFGHTHVPVVFSSNGLCGVEANASFRLGQETPYFINPGSVGQPRDGDLRAAFGLFDPDANVYETIRMEYPGMDTR